MEFRKGERTVDRPAWGLNARLITEQEYQTLREELGGDPEEDWVLIPVRLEGNGEEKRYVIGPRTDS